MACRTRSSRITSRITTTSWISSSAERRISSAIGGMTAAVYNRPFGDRMPSMNPSSNPKRSIGTDMGCVSDDAGDASDAPSARPASVDVARIERAVREILVAIGEDPDREGLLKTPNRVARAYGELMAGLREDPRQQLRTVFHERYQEVVLLRDIPFHSMCEHHLLPFTGRAHVAYLPDGKVVG